MQRITEYLSHLWSDGWQTFSRWLEQTNQSDWSVIFVVTVAIGLICMRGFKSKL